MNYEKRSDLDMIVAISTGFAYPYSHIQWQSGLYREATQEELLANGFGSGEVDTAAVRIIPLPSDLLSMGWDAMNDFIAHHGLGTMMAPNSNIEDARMVLRGRIDARNNVSGNSHAINALLPDKFKTMRTAGLIKFASDNNIEVDPLSTPDQLRIKIVAALGQRVSEAA